MKEKTMSLEICNGGVLWLAVGIAGRRVLPRHNHINLNKYKYESLADWPFIAGIIRDFGSGPGTHSLCPDTMGSGCGTTLSPVWIALVTLLILAGAGPVASDDILRCYKCDKTDKLCGTGRVPYGNILECGNSTMCFATTHTLIMLDSNWTTTLRGCAQQVREVHNLVKKRWDPGYIVDNDAYQEGCTTKDNVQYCYCRGSLCNSSTDLRRNRALPVLLIVSTMFLGKLLLPV